MAGHHAQQTAGASGNRGRDTEKQWRIGKSNHKEGQHEREFKDDGRLGKNRSERASSEQKWGGYFNKQKWKKQNNTKFWDCTPLSSEAKGETENRAWKRQAKYLPERQKSETVGQSRQLQADTVLQKEMLVKTRKRKKVGIFVEPCHVGGF